MQETKLHYLWCKKEQMVETRKTHMQLLTKTLKTVNTYPGIITTIQHIASHGYTKLWVDKLEKDPDSLTQRLVTVVNHQHHMGQNSLFKGHVVKGWRHLQEEWEKATQQPNTVEKWIKNVITALHTYTYACWKTRNEVVHQKGENKGTIYSKEQRLYERVSDLYKQGRANLNEREKSYFKLPVEQRLKKGVVAMELWVQVVEIIFRK